MKSIIDIIIAILFILFGLNMGVRFLHKEVKKATIKRLHQGLSPLSPFTKKMVGKPLQTKRHHKIKMRGMGIDEKNNMP